MDSAGKFLGPSVLTYAGATCVEEAGGYMVNFV